MNDHPLTIPGKIKERMYFWFLKYHNQTIDEFNGSEQFTFFDMRPAAEKDQHLNMIDLQPGELPVFFLAVNNTDVIINTTQIRPSDGDGRRISPLFRFSMA